MSRRAVPFAESRMIAFAQAAAGIGVLCLMDVVVKYLAHGVAVPVITLARYTTGTILALMVWQWQGRPRLTRKMLPVHIVRGILIGTMALAFYWALTQLPLAETITLSFIAPLLVPPLASLFLGEKMQPRFLAAGALGFAGVVVTAQGAPDFSGDRLLALGAVLYAAVAYAGSSVLLRHRWLDDRHADGGTGADAGAQSGGDRRAAARPADAGLVRHPRPDRQCGHAVSQPRLCAPRSTGAVGHGIHRPALGGAVRLVHLWRACPPAGLDRRGHHPCRLHLGNAGTSAAATGRDAGLTVKPSANPRSSR
jgi:uncharacterized membrane protein